LIPQSTFSPASVINPHWYEDTAALSARFVLAEPFPHLILDDFLKADVAHALLREFPDIHSMVQTRDYVFGRKYEMSRISEVGPHATEFKRSVLERDFSLFLKSATDLDVFLDPNLVGGGFHQGGDGSFLDLHVDFNLHPTNRHWLRMLNILIYLNIDWLDEYGGDLLISASPRAKPTPIKPVFNRAVIMLTSARTFHGYQRMSLPPGISRKSVALYAYRDLVDEEQPTPRTTRWFPQRASRARRVIAATYNRCGGVVSHWRRSS